MCERNNIVTVMLGMSLLYVLCAAGIALAALSLSGNDLAAVAYGGANQVAAFFLFINAIVLCPMSCIGLIGARHHNKFCLAYHLGATSFVVFSLWVTGAGCEAFLRPSLTTRSGRHVNTSPLTRSSQATPEFYQLLWHDLTRSTGSSGW